MRSFAARLCRFVGEPGKPDPVYPPELPRSNKGARDGLKMRRVLSDTADRADAHGVVTLRKEDLLIFAGLAIAVGVAGFGVQRIQQYLAGDWGEVAECRETFWTCESKVGGKARSARPEPVAFTASAKACDEYRAYETSLRRASFECSMSRAVVGGSCREIETDCSLPNRPF